MKFLKSTFALAAVLALWAGVAQAQIPVSFSLTASVQRGNAIGGVTVNNNTLIQKVGSFTGTTIPAGAKLVVNTNGGLQVVTAAGAVLWDFYYSPNTRTTNTTITSSTFNGVTTFVTNVTITTGEAYAESDDYTFSFYDTVWSGTETSSNAFAVKGNAVGGYVYIYFYKTSSTTGYRSNGTTVNEGGTSWYDELEVSDGTQATVNTKLAAGVYTLGFTINASGYYYSSIYGTGPVLGSVVASGTQTGGTSFLDPFNGFGAFYTDYSY